MATDRPRRRNSTDKAIRKTVKTSLVVAVDLHARWSAAASLRGQDRNAFAVDVLTEALKGLVILDRRKSPGEVDPSSQEESADAA